MNSAKIVLVLGLCLISVFTIIAQNEDDKKVLMCYYGGWAFYREYPMNFTIAHFDAHLCTHVIFAFANIHMDGHIADLYSPEYYTEWVKKKDENQDLKILLGIGGAAAGVYNFSRMANDTTSRSRFINQTILYIDKYNFDGIDVDWEFPGVSEDSLPEDMDNFVILLSEMKQRYEDHYKRKILLTASVNCENYGIELAYDIPGLNDALDYFNLMAYDLKMFRGGFNDGTNLIGHHSPLYASPEDDWANGTYNVEWIINRYIEKGASPEKLVLGLGAYGHTYKLSSRAQHNFYDPAIGLGAPGPYSQAAGTLFYTELCFLVHNTTSRWEFNWNDEYMIPYAFNDDTWVGYDDEESVRLKTDYAMSFNLAGMMIWSIELDDCNNYCRGWSNCPLISAVKNRLEWHERQLKKPKNLIQN